MELELSNDTQLNSSVPSGNASMNQPSPTHIPLDQSNSSTDSPLPLQSVESDNYDKTQLQVDLVS